MSDKESTTQRTAQGNEMVGLDRYFFKAAMLDWYYTERHGSTNLRRSTGD